MLRAGRSQQEALGGRPSALGRAFTAEAAEDAEEFLLSLMNADEHGSADRVIG
jgi:hypothetical protein